MRKDFIKFDTSKLAKDKGFDEPCIDCYNEYGKSYSDGWCERVDDHFETYFNNSGLEIVFLFYYTAPTQAELQTWLREEHFIEVCVMYWNKRWHVSIYDMKGKFSFGTGLFEHKKGFKEYEDALEKGLFEALKFVKDEEKGEIDS